MFGYLHFFETLYLLYACSEKFATPVQIAPLTTIIFEMAVILEKSACVKHNLGCPACLNTFKVSKTCFYV